MKPREWWIGAVKSDLNDVAFHSAYSVKPKSFDTIHVIEKSAYDELMVRCLDAEKSYREASDAKDHWEIAHESLQAQAEKLVEALRWIAGNTEKPYTTYYERILSDNTIIPPYFEIAEKALAEYSLKSNKETK